MSHFEQPSRWSLDDLFPQPAAEPLEAALDQLEQAVTQFESLRPSLTDAIAAPDFQAALAALESITRLKNRIEAYAELAFSEDTQNPAALSLRDRVSQVMTGIANRTVFFTLWFKDLPEDIAESLAAGSGDLRYFLQTIRRFKPFTLGETEEKIITTKDANGVEGIIVLYDMITNAFKFSLEVNGQKKVLTYDELVGYFGHPSPDVRACAYQELYRVFAENASVLAQMYIYRARDWHDEGMDLRGYPSPIAARNLENDLPDSVVDTLLAACRQNAGLFRRYFELKRRWLGLEKFRRYDIYAPLTPSDKTFDFPAAAQMVFDSYRTFSPDVAALTMRVYDAHHLDAETRHGKRGGAFCYTALPELTPWVSVNYAGRAHDIATLAHELGHAIHNLLAAGHSPITQSSSLPLAETASVFGEMLLTDSLLQHEKDPSVRRELLANALDAAYLTVMRQAYFTIFEKEAHGMIAEGAPVEALADHYMENLREQFGPEIQIGDEFKWEWLTISHFYEVPFYTYAYSFGQLLVLALYQQYRLEGEAFLPRYLRLLSYGGSEAPLKILSEAGFDVKSPAFWQGGFDFLGKMLAELEQLS